LASDDGGGGSKIAEEGFGFLWHHHGDGRWGRGEKKLTTYVKEHHVGGKRYIVNLC
jgi:hypothetical protein